jgi:hypothetical protein
VGRCVRPHAAKVRRILRVASGLTLPVLVTAGCVSTSSPPTQTSPSSRPVPLTFHTYIYSHMVQPWPLKMRYKRVGKGRFRQIAGSGVYSPTTIAYTTMGGSNCVEAPDRLVRASAHQVTFLSRINGGPFCFDDDGTNLLVIAFNRAIFDPTHPVALHLRSTDNHRYRINAALSPQPTNELHLRFGSISGRSLRWSPGGGVRALPQRISVFGADRRRFRTDAAGRFTLTDIPTGWYWLDNCVGCPTNPDCHGGVRVFVRAQQTAQVRLTCRPMRR